MAQAEATFELGTNGANVATTDVPCVNKWDATIFAGTLIYDNTHVAHGNLAMKTNAKLIGWNATTLGTITDHYGRFYVWTAGSTEIVRVLSGGINGTQAFTIQYSAGAIFATSSTGATMASGAFDLRSKLVRIEYHLIHSATVGQVVIQTFNGDAITPMDNITSTANFNTLASADTIRYGSLSVDTWMDDIVANATNFPGPYPTGPGPGPSQRATVQISSGVSW